MMMVSALRVQVASHKFAEDGGCPQTASRHSCASTPSPVASSGCWDFRSATTNEAPQTPAPAWGDATAAAQVHAPHYRLKVALPRASDGADCSDTSAPLSSAARVLSITGEHSTMSSWLEQQVCCAHHAAGQPAPLAAAGEQLVEPAVESPAITCSHALRSLPAPAFQLLGLL